MPREASSLRFLVLAVLAASPGFFSCGGSPPQGGGFPAVTVETVTLEEVPIERATEYVATLRSRRSTTLQPMVEGIVTRIAVRSGDRVPAGATILEIDGNRQRAAVASLESLRAAREAGHAYARREAERQLALFKAGAASAQDSEEAQTTLETAQAQLRAVEEQIREQSVELAYYRVTAPTSGVVGDVPVRIGDRVTRSTVLTTIDAGGGLEIYLRVPVRRAADLARGLSLRILDDSGGVQAETAIDFVSPQVDEVTQTVLAKAPLTDASGFRTEQQVRAQIVWGAERGIRIPVVAVSRVGGRYFAFVAEESDGKTVARQKGIQVGPIVGNDYVLHEGLSRGDRLIVSGIQKIRDGAPIDPGPPIAPERG